MKIYKFALIFYFVFVFLGGKQLKAEISEETIKENKEKQEKLYLSLSNETEDNLDVSHMHSMNKKDIKEDKSEVKMQKSNETGIYMEVQARPIIFSSYNSGKTENFSPEKDTTEITGSKDILEKSNEIE
ncbi:hypothetical protein HY745_00190 [Candidatus Desantisbacteria bacterium]|nr:hypothetical protein [Candidatus Desantisbacteria bacterium]